MDRQNIERPSPDGDEVRTREYQWVRAADRRGIVQFVTSPQPIPDAGTELWLLQA